MKKKIQIYLLLLIIPLSLYVNFFIAKKTLWNMEIKAWLIYSALIMGGELLILLSFEFFMPKVLNKFKLSKEKEISKFINVSIIAFLLGNIFFIFPWHGVLWLFVPIFQGMLIFVFLNIYLKEKSQVKRSWKEKFFTLEKGFKGKDGVKRKSNVFVVFVVILFFVGVNMGLQNVIKKRYNPIRKSLIYSMDGVKVKF